MLIQYFEGLFENDNFFTKHVMVNIMMHDLLVYKLYIMFDVQPK